jgi:pimeloyl-ACP methyl ester carboxylesterase
MRDLLEVLDVGPVTVVGHSLGGGVAAQFAYQYPERCERLVLVASGGVAREVSPILRLASAPGAELALAPMQVPVARFGIRLAARAALEVARLAGADIGRDAAEIIRVFDGLPDGSARTAFTRTLRSVVDQRGQLVTMLDRVYLAGPLPTFLIWGAHDGIIPVEHAYRAHEAIAGSRLSIFEEAGHFPHHSDPARFVGELVAFVDDAAAFEHDRDAWRDRLCTGRPSGGADSGDPSTPEGELPIMRGRPGGRRLSVVGGAHGRQTAGERT